MAASATERFVEVWNRKGLEAAGEVGWDPAITWVEPPEWPGRRTIEGRQALMERMRERFEMLGVVELGFVSETPVAEGLVISAMIAKGRGSSSGVPVQTRQFLVIEAGEHGARRVYEFMTREPAEAKAAELATGSR